VAGCCEYGDESAVSGATELVSYMFLSPAEFLKLAAGIY
jgi:hypothetical protein